MAQNLLDAMAELRVRFYFLSDVDILIAAAYGASMLNDPIRACRLLAASDATAFRSPASYQWYLHTRRCVRDSLDRTTIDRIRAEEDATTVGIALRAEEQRVQAVLAPIGNGT